MKTNKTTKFKSWELRDTTVDTESVLYIANFIPVLKIEKIRAVFEFIKNQLFEGRLALTQG